MLRPGCYPAAVTPFAESGEVDHPGMARLLAWYESQGCAGAVLAGTNGEGPSLSAVEKRDLLRAMMPVRGSLDLILGVATSSLSEAVWSCRQASKLGAAAALVMPPGYFREASEEGIARWFEALLDQSDLPMLIYNFPQRTGLNLTPNLLARLAPHPRMIGAKDSSGNVDNLNAYPEALPGKSLFVGNETLLLKALEKGWSGTISGAANVIPGWLSQVVALWPEDPARARIKFEVALVGIEALRKEAQPAANKAILARLGILDSNRVRLPLQSLDEVEAVWSGLKGLLPA